MFGRNIYLYLCSFAASSNASPTRSTGTNLMGLFFMTISLVCWSTMAVSANQGHRATCWKQNNNNNNQWHFISIHIYCQTVTDLDAGFLDNGGSAQVPGDGDHGVLADPVGQGVMIFGPGQTRAWGQVDNQTPRTWGMAPIFCWDNMKITLPPLVLLSFSSNNWTPFMTPSRLIWEKSYYLFLYFCVCS